MEHFINDQDTLDIIEDYYLELRDILRTNDEHNYIAFKLIDISLTPRGLLVFKRDSKQKFISSKSDLRVNNVSFFTIREMGKPSNIETDATLLEVSYNDYRYKVSSKKGFDFIEERITYFNYRCSAKFNKKFKTVSHDKFNSTVSIIIK